MKFSLSWLADFVDVASVGGSFVGVLSGAGTELAGTWTQGPSSLPLTLHLSKP